MKKIIASTCAIAAIGFAVALANADDNVSNDSTQMVQPSTTNTTTTTADAHGNTMSSSTQWKNMKTCTDSEGVTYYKGKKGYATCITQMKKSQKKDQMGGTSGTDPESNSSDTQTSPDNN